MKNSVALSSLLLSAALSLSASPGLAATANSVQLDNYFQADSAISVVALVLAAGSLAIANLVSRKREQRLASVTSRAAGLNSNKWQAVVYRNLEAELQDYSSRFREAA